MQYTIITGDSSYDLSQKIKNKIEYGWEPQGGVSFVFHSGFRETWAQAMVKK